MNRIDSNKRASLLQPTHTVFIHLVDRRSAATGWKYHSLQGSFRHDQLPYGAGKNKTDRETENKHKPLNYV